MNTRPFLLALFASAALALGACSSDTGSHAGHDTGGSGHDTGAMNDSGGGGKADTAGGGGDDTGTMGDSGTGDTGSGGDMGSDVTADMGPQDHIKTIFLIVMENHNWSDIKGDSSAPYINDTLLPMGAHAENYFDNPAAVHPSEPNYIWLEAGDNLGIDNDDDPDKNPLDTTDHLVTQLEDAGVTWRSYQEDMPDDPCPINSSGLYGAKHNPMVFFTDVSGDPPATNTQRCADHMAPMTQLETDLQNGTVAQYNFITPNLCHDMHNIADPRCNHLIDQIANGDEWLSEMVPKILASPAYQDDGALFITWDESEDGEKPIGMIVLSPLAKTNYSNDVPYYHSSMLRTVEEVFGVPLLRDAANQPSLEDMFNTYP